MIAAGAAVIAALRGFITSLRVVIAGEQVFIVAEKSSSPLKTLHRRSKIFIADRHRSLQLAIRLLICVIRVICGCRALAFQALPKFHLNFRTANRIAGPGGIFLSQCLAYSACLLS
jgi:hypothetical protein